jgi:hypothetical protein
MNLQYLPPDILEYITNDDIIMRYMLSTTCKNLKLILYIPRSYREYLTYINNLHISERIGSNNIDMRGKLYLPYTHWIVNHILTAIKNGRLDILKILELYIIYGSYQQINRTKYRPPFIIGNPRVANYLYSIYNNIKIHVGGLRGANIEDMEIYLKYGGTLRYTNIWEIIRGDMLLVFKYIETLGPCIRNNGRLISLKDGLEDIYRKMNTRGLHNRTNRYILATLGWEPCYICTYYGGYCYS